MKLNIFFLFCIFYTPFLHAQKDGIGGYGELQYNILFSSKFPNNYLLGGGGVVINNNFIIGGYVGSMINMYTSKNALNPQDTNDISRHPYSVNTTASISDFGVNVGFNFNSQKDFQILFTLKTGVTILSIKDDVISSEYIAYLKDSTGKTPPTKKLFENNVYTVFGYNAMPQMAFQFYIGKSMKLFTNVGYRLVIIDKSFFNPITKSEEGLLLDRWMFNSPFLNFGVSFGSF